MTDKIELTSVKVDLTVLLKIIKHAKEANFKLATGQLHGVYSEKNVEITNSYAVPNKDDDTAEDDFDSNMIARLEEINMDNNKVGWYQVCYANDHLSGESVATTFDYQTNVPYAVYLVYDILEVERGLRSPFKAYRINSKYMDLMKDTKVTYHQMKSLNFKLDKIYQEVPLEIVKTPLQLAYLHEQKRSLKNKFSSAKGALDLIAYFERTISFLVESLEDQSALDLKMQHDHFAGLKNETKETRIKNLEIPTADFVETFVSKQRINNFLSKINNCGKFQLETSFLLSDNTK